MTSITNNTSRKFATVICSLLFVLLITACDPTSSEISSSLLSSYSSEGSSISSEMISSEMPVSSETSSSETPSSEDHVIITSIADARMASEGTTLTIAGTVTAIIPSASGTVSFNVQQNQQAIQIYGVSTSGVTDSVKVNDVVQATGSKKVFYGSHQIDTITNFTRVGPSGSTIQPTLVETWSNEALLDKDSMLVELRGLTYLSGTIEATGFSTINFSFGAVTVPLYVSANLRSATKTAIQAKIDQLDSQKSLTFRGPLGWFSGPQLLAISEQHLTVINAGPIEGQAITLSDSDVPTSLEGNDFGPMIHNQDGFDFDYQEAKNQASYHVVFSHGGYITNDEDSPLSNLKSIRVVYDQLSDYGSIAYRFDNEPIDAPHSANNPLQNGEAVYAPLVDGTQFFFSIYVSTGEYAIVSIELNYENDSSYVAPSYRGTQEIDIYAMNDFHGATREDLGEYQAGATKIADFLRNKQLENPKGTALLASGDMWQGTADSNITKGKLVNEWMNYLGFEQFTFGNHEFDWNEPAIIANQSTANFPFLAINIYHRDTDQRVPYAQPSTMIRRKGVNIGIIGAISNVYSSISSSNVKNIKFLTGSTLTNLVLDEANKLRQDGADFIIYSIHGGEGSAPDSLTASAVDLVFEGHSHSNYVNMDSNGVYHLQTSGLGLGIAAAKVHFNLDYDTYSIDAGIYDSSDYLYGNEDPTFKSIYQWFENNQIAEIRDEVLTTNLGYTGPSTFADLVVQRYYEDFKAQALAGGYNVILAGGSVTSRNYATHYGGPITYGDVYGMFPFDNYIAVASTTGANLKSRFINSNYRTYPNNINTSSIVDSATYYIICDSWTFDYVAANVTKVMDFDAVHYTRDVLANYLRTL